jgi:cobalt-precorrin 5A hydrolase
MIVAGVGCRKGASADDIGAVIADALARAGFAPEALDLIAAPELKRGEYGLAAAAAALGVPLVLIAKADLEAAGARAETRSERVLALMGIPSVAEAAALAGGGPTARLIVPRIAIGPATCALAVSEERS